MKNYDKVNKGQKRLSKLISSDLRNLNNKNNLLTMINNSSVGNTVEIKNKETTEKKSDLNSISDFEILYRKVIAHLSNETKVDSCLDLLSKLFKEKIYEIEPKKEIKENDTIVVDNSLNISFEDNIILIKLLVETALKVGLMNNVKTKQAIDKSKILIKLIKLMLENSIKAVKNTNYSSQEKSDKDINLNNSNRTSNLEGNQFANVILNLQNDVELDQLVEFENLFEVKLKLISDDSFTFNKSVKEVQNIILSLNDVTTDENNIYEVLSNLNNLKIQYSKSENKIANNELQLNETQEDKEESSSEKIYSNNSKDIISTLIVKFLSNDEILLRVLKRYSVLECLKIMNLKSNCSWALPSIKDCLRTAILNKRKFFNDQTQEIVRLINSDSHTSQFLGQRKIASLDSKIKDDALKSNHTVTDSRAVKLYDGTNKWELKQSGLTYSKLSMH